MVEEDSNTIAYRPMHADHFRKAPMLDPRGMSVMAWDAGGHDKAKGEGGRATNPVIAIGVLIEKVHLKFDLVHKGCIFIFFPWAIGVLYVLKVQLQGILELVDDLL